MTLDCSKDRPQRRLAVAGQVVAADVGGEQVEQAGGRVGEAVGGAEHNNQVVRPAAGQVRAGSGERDDRPGRPAAGQPIQHLFEVAPGRLRNGPPPGEPLPLVVRDEGHRVRLRVAEGLEPTAQGRDQFRRVAGGEAQVQGRRLGHVDAQADDVRLRSGRLRPGRDPTGSRARRCGFLTRSSFKQ